MTSIYTNPTYTAAQIYQLCDARREPIEGGVLSRSTLNAAGFAADEPAAINTVNGLSPYAAARE